jgi:hypothetical protein
MHRLVSRITCWVKTGIFCLRLIVFEAVLLSLTMAGVPYPPIYCEGKGVSLLAGLPEIGNISLCFDSSDLCNLYLPSKYTDGGASLDSLC